MEHEEKYDEAGMRECDETEVHWSGQGNLFYIMWTGYNFRASLEENMFDKS